MNKIRKALGIATKIAVTTAAMAVSSPGSAASLLFGYTYDGKTVSGTFTTADIVDANGFSRVTDLAGTFGGAAMALLDPGSYPMDFPNDNLVRTTGTFVSGLGVSFTAAGQNYNLWYDDLTSTYQNCVGAMGEGCESMAISGLTVTLAPTTPVGAVPEPATWLMLTLGFGLIGTALRQRPARVRLVA